MSEILKRVEAVIAERKNAAAADSYVASLFAKGDAKLAEKLGEEAVETVIASLNGDDGELVSEAADLLFHLLVLLSHKGLSLADVEAELARREGLSGHEEKAGRAPS